MKRIMLFLLAVFLFVTPNAFAAFVEFDIVDLYDWGRLYTYNAGTWVPTNNNPFGNEPGNSIPAGTVGNADGKEDAWGIAQVEQILLQPMGTPIFRRNVDPFELTVFYRGFDDDYISYPDLITGNANVGSKSLAGGLIRVYADSNVNYNPSLGTAGRTAVDQYATVTDGELFLELSPVSQNQYGHSLISTFNFINLAGNGVLYAGVTNNPLALGNPYFDTNSYLFGSDFLFQYTVVSNDPSAPGTPVADWVVRGDGRAEGNMVPVPNTILLLGSGLIGLLGIARKRIHR